MVVAVVASDAAAAVVDLAAAVVAAEAEAVAVVADANQTTVAGQMFARMLTMPFVKTIRD